MALPPTSRRINAAAGIGGTLTIIDLAAGKVARTVKLGGRPWGALATPK
jgi:YVTN family beta-propeller protein